MTFELFMEAAHIRRTGVRRLAPGVRADLSS